MKILIVRHGEAETYAASDAERELTPRGRQQAELAGECLFDQTLDFDQVWVSPYVRAQQTADGLLVAAQLSKVPRHTVDSITPDCSPSEVIDQIHDSAIESLMLISHQPLVSSIIGLLVSAGGYAGLPMAPASMALIETDSVMSGCCTLKWLRHAPTYQRS